MVFFIYKKKERKEGGGDVFEKTERKGTTHGKSVGSKSEDRDVDEGESGLKSPNNETEANASGGESVSLGLE